MGDELPMLTMPSAAAGGPAGVASEGQQQQAET